MAQDDKKSGAPLPPTSDSGGSRKTAGDAVLSVLERLVSQGAQFLVFVAAARLLGPADFGLFALVSACAMLLLVVAEAGWAPFIMSREGTDDRVPLQVLFVAILCGISFAGLGAGVALAAGSLGVSLDTVLLALLFAGWVALANASSAQRGVLIWMDRLKAAALAAIAGEVVGLAVALYALSEGAGVFALVYGRSACQVTILLLGIAAMRRLPVPGLDKQIMRELWIFSAQIFSSRILVHARLHFITLAIGAFLGPAAVGFFRAAERLVGAASEIVSVPGQILAWTLLRRARDQGDAAQRTARVAEQATRHLKAVTALGAPLFLWLILLNDALIEGLLGPEWQPAAALVAILAIGRMFLFAGVLTEPLLTILGQTRRLPGFMATIFTVSVALTLVCVPFGVTVIAWGQTGIAALVMVATLRFFNRHAGLSPERLLAPLRVLILPLGAGCSAIWLADLGMAQWDLPLLLHAFVAGLIGGAVYAVSLALLDKAFWAQIRLAILTNPAAPEALR